MSRLPKMAIAVNVWEIYFCRWNYSFDSCDLYSLLDRLNFYFVWHEHYVSFATRRQVLELFHRVLHQWPSRDFIVFHINLFGTKMDYVFVDDSIWSDNNRMQLCSTVPTVSLVLFFMGKIFIRHATQSMYVFTGELWPTSSRSTMLNTCSMFGRIGSILAPMTPLLVQFNIIQISTSITYFVILFLPHFLGAIFGVIAIFSFLWHRGYCWSSISAIARDIQHETTRYDRRSQVNRNKNRT